MNIDIAVLFLCWRLFCLCSEFVIAENWLEAGEVFMGPILAHVYIACKEKNINLLQDEFLRFHDKKTRRLFFVWEVSFIKNIPFFFLNKFEMT